MERCVPLLPAAEGAEVVLKAQFVGLEGHNWFGGGNGRGEPLVGRPLGASAARRLMRVYLVHDQLGLVRGGLEEVVSLGDVHGS